ncbi:uncharacterized protein MELLADRAFT_69286 [Melampsora larici-populina 98AG31]|uniref:DUF4219 domain-containing protein n=1 Tax=Melampsora larici-populina (strain 98AG31 / pathotype 3-4-7) TaxID=747676 RepID=F4SA55_MELLP|nr:uncharacterized protein MELLADRAFT_69286 [Melampsora larici-populina 98AG31]EGF98488.1 hypothetical protein MELLADRAFT_69286 [Melampsora larici-populina 98AG31]
MPNEQILLTDTNYGSWKPKMEDKLKRLQLLEITLRPPSMTEDFSAEDLNWFTVLERKAYDVIIGHLDQQSSLVANAHTINQPKTGSSLWKYLEGRYSVHGIINHTTLYKKFENIQYKFNTNLATFCNEIRTSINEFSKAQLEISTKLLIVMILAKLRGPFDYRVQLISQDLNDTHDVEYVLKRLEEDVIFLNMPTSPMCPTTPSVSSASGKRKTPPLSDFPPKSNKTLLKIPPIPTEPSLQWYEPPYPPRRNGK